MRSRMLPVKGSQEQSKESACGVTHEGIAAGRFGPDARVALIIAHPGHELRVHGWLEFAHPSVFVLSDGSGRSGISRLPATRRILDATGAEPGSIFGWLSDREFYATLLARDCERFVSLAEELSNVLVSEQVDYVAGDNIEGYNPAHDVCRLVIDTAAALAAARGRATANFEFPVVGASIAPHRRSMTFHLSDEALSRKVAAARSYIELWSEVDSALKDMEEADLRVERLNLIDNPIEFAGPPDNPPFYETYGERQVSAGYYNEVIRYREHVAPIMEALRKRIS